jgi:hypothetical protein
MQRLMRLVTSAAVFVPVLTFAGCSVDVNDKGPDKAAVDIHSPVGDVSVRTDVNAPETGLPVYPGATLLRDGDESGSANVDIGAFGFGLKVAAAKYESGDGQQEILDFYRNAMTRYGAVTECRGDVDFPSRAGAVVCRAEPASRDVQLVVGTRDNQHVVAVKPRGSGSEIGVAFVQTSGAD